MTLLKEATNKKERAALKLTRALANRVYLAVITHPAFDSMEDASPILNAMEDLERHLAMQAHEMGDE